jgi:hypothetical protein
MRKHYPVAILLILLAAIALSASLATNANALPTFNTAVGGIGPCVTCHTQASVHAVPGHSTVIPTCTNCHPTGTAMPLPSKCATCHGGTTAILASAQHTITKCGSTPGCHGVTPPGPVATTVSLKVAPKSIKLKKSVKATGAVTPIADLAGKKVALKAEMKKGAKWVKAKTGSVVVSATGTYSWTYKPAKKGSYRVTASVAKTAAYNASKSKVMTFKVN